MEGGGNKPIFFTSRAVSPWSPSERIRPKESGLGLDLALGAGGGKAKSLNASVTMSGRTSTIFILTILPPRTRSDFSLLKISSASHGHPYLFPLPRKSSSTGKAPK